MLSDIFIGFFKTFLISDLGMTAGIMPWGDSDPADGNPLFFRRIVVLVEAQLRADATKNADYVENEQIWR